MARSRTSFANGNLAALTHGARSQRFRALTRKALAGELRALALEQHPHLAQHPILLDLLVDAMADVRQLRDFIDELGGPVSAKGQLYKPMEMLRARERDLRDTLRMVNSIQPPRAALAAQAHAELLAEYAPHLEAAE